MRSLKIHILIPYLLFSVVLKAQDFPYHYFSHIDPMLNNPSLAAVENKIKAGVVSYNLWSGGFKPMNDFAVSFSIAPGFNNSNRRALYHTWIGLGGAILRQRIGPFNQNIFHVDYAYHIPLNKKTLLSLGISGLIEFLEIDINSLSPLDKEDSRLLTGTNSSVLFDGGFGASVKGEDFRILLSIINLTPGIFKFKDSQAKDIENYRKLFLTGNYLFRWSEKFGIQPEISFRNSIQKTLNFDSSLRFKINDVSFGLGYRSENTLFIYTQLLVKNFSINYTSENPVNSNHMIGNGHTFSVSWIFGPIN